jgi:hypothetical protein
MDIIKIWVMSNAKIYSSYMHFGLPKLDHRYLNFHSLYKFKLCWRYRRFYIRIHYPNIWYDRLKLEKRGL